eukprot:gene1574-2210_t
MMLQEDQSPSKCAVYGPSTNSEDSTVMTYAQVAGENYLGTGETGCRPGIACDVDNGNCDKLVACDSDAVAQCGACPAGYSGTGDTVCVDEDGCARDPCFPGVECVDIPAPGVGRTCQSCPEGYRGDGATCELCAVSIHVDAAMSTVVNGKVKRSQENQLAAAFNGLNEPDCTFSQMDGWMDGGMDGWMDGWMDGRMDGWMGGWMDGWLDGWMDEWMDGWKRDATKEWVVIMAHV